MARILDKIQSPSDLKRLNVEQMKTLAADIREEIVKTVRKNGGHLGANLGAVEIILAVHSVIDSPQDKLIFDVGHQAYPHKLVTGRFPLFDTLRQFGGLSGFPSRKESPHDAFGVGHAGTSISAALGYCLARDAQGEKYRVVTVTGDGALTAGMSFEALNHAGELDTDLVVILNDNEMSIGPNVGALATYLTRMRTDPTVNRARDEMERLIARIPAIGGQMMKAADKLTDTLRYLVVPGAFFQELGFAYYGPIDGHNIPLMQRVLRDAFNRGGPVLIHAITQKGRGYQPAEEDPGRLHAIKAPSHDNGNPIMSTTTYSDVFGQAMLEFAKANKKMVAITAAMPEGTGLSSMATQLPAQLIDVGIAEQHAVTLAAGMACGGCRPVVAIYSSFMQRAYDQLIHDVCLQNLPITFCLDRAGLVGDDGPTHHGVFDLSFLRSMPHMVVMAPRNGHELRTMLYTALRHDGPVAIRYPKGVTTPPNFSVPLQPLSLGKGEVIRQGEHVAILAVGSMVEQALLAADNLDARGIHATVASARFVKPLDKELISHLIHHHEGLVTVEENAVAGGYGSAVLEFLSQNNMPLHRVRILGIPDTFVEHGSMDRLFELCGLTPTHIADVAYNLVEDVGHPLNPAAVH